MRNESDLIKTTIKGREVILYLTTIEDLNEVKSKGILGDLCVLFFSIFIGALVSIFITKTTNDFSGQSLKLLSILIYVIAFGSVVFLLLSVYFYYSSYSVIERIKMSGEIKSVSAPEKSKSTGFEIIEAIYYTDNYSMDITEPLKEKIKDGRLSTNADNNIAGDPEHGVRKKLRIKYSFNGRILEKEYPEKTRVELP